MSSYLKRIYFRDEKKEGDYPSLLCKHIVNQYLDTSYQGKSILDIGSGKGNHLVGFARLGLKPSGIDKRDECIDAEHKFEIKGCNIETEPFPYDDDSFDYIYSKSVLEHVMNTDNFMKEALRVLKPGGKAVFLTPDWKSQCRYFWDDYTHVKAFTRKSLQNAMIINDYKKVECDYFLQLPFIWKHPKLEFVCKIIDFLTLDSWKWKDKEEQNHRAWIRFSKEKMLLVTGEK